MNNNSPNRPESPDLLYSDYLPYEAPRLNVHQIYEQRLNRFNDEADDEYHNLYNSSSADNTPRNNNNNNNPITTNNNNNHPPIHPIKINNSIPIKKDNIIVNVTKNTMVYDPIEMEEVSLIAFLSEKKTRATFYYNSTWYIFDRADILSTNMINTSVKGNGIIYECRVVGYINPENVITDQPYFKLKLLGMPFDYIKKTYIDSIINATNKQYFILEKTKHELPSVVGHDLFNNSGRDPTITAVSNAHCQHGQSGFEYIIKYLMPTFNERKEKRKQPLIIIRKQTKNKKQRKHSKNISKKKYYTKPNTYTKTKKTKNKTKNKHFTI